MAGESNRGIDSRKVRQADQLAAASSLLHPTKALVLPDYGHCAPPDLIGYRAQSAPPHRDFRCQWQYGKSRGFGVEMPVRLSLTKVLVGWNPILVRVRKS